LKDRYKEGEREGWLGNERERRVRAEKEREGERGGERDRRERERT
jgi:hypothetical protein